MKTKLLLLATLSCAASTATFAKSVIFKEGDKSLTIGGRAHLQYIQRDPKDGETTDDLGFRRIRVELDTQINKNWSAQIEWDFGEGSAVDTDAGESNGELIDGYIQYKFEDGGKVQFGHTRVVQFSRSDLTSSNNSHQVERTLAGNTNYGIPARQTGVGYRSERSEDTKFVWDLGLAMAEIDPDNNQIDFDSEVTSDPENSEGLLVGGRVQYFPQGFFKERHEKFSGKIQWGFALAAYSWSNDGDQEGLDSDDADVDTVTGIELSSAFRGHGLSIDAQYNIFAAEAVTADLEKIAGASIFEENGDANFNVLALDAGYLVIADKLQLALSYASLTADAYNEDYNQTQFGLSYFVNKHSVKFQGSYRIEETIGGVKDNDRNSFLFQAQYLY